MIPYVEHFERLDIDTVEWMLARADMHITTLLSVVRNGGTCEPGAIATAWADYKALTELRALLWDKRR
jgi:hypothetical protein